MLETCWSISAPDFAVGMAAGVHTHGETGRLTPRRPALVTARGRKVRARVWRDFRKHTNENNVGERVRRVQLLILLNGCHIIASSARFGDTKVVLPITRRLQLRTNAIYCEIVFGVGDSNNRVLELTPHGQRLVSACLTQGGRQGSLRDRDGGTLDQDRIG